MEKYGVVHSWADSKFTTENLPIMRVFARRKASGVLGVGAIDLNRHGASVKRRYLIAMHPS
jgi:hypothetical protein